MVESVTLLLSITLQLLAAAYAWRLQRVTNRHLAWMLLVAALCLQIVRRVVSFFAVSADSALPLAEIADGLTLLISLLFLLGMASMASLMLSSEDARKKLQAEIGERHQTERALQESQRTYRTLLGNLPGMAYRCRNDADWTMEFVSEGCKALTGYPVGDLLENKRISYGSIIHPADRTQVAEAVQAGLRAKKPFQMTYRIVTATGHEKWVWEQGIGIYASGKDAVTIEGFVADITERIEAEQAMQHSEAMLRSVFRAAPIGLGIVTDRVFGLTNSQFQEMLGYSEEDLAGQSARLIYETEEEYERVGEVKYEQIDREGTGTIETRLRRKDGQIIEVLLSSSELDRNNRAAGVIFSVLDITERNRAAAALRHSEEALNKERNLLRTLIDNLPDFVYVKDIDGRFVTGNTAQVKLLGASSADALVGKTDADFYPPAIAAQFAISDSLPLKQGEPVINREEYLFDPQGSPLVILTSKIPLHDSQGAVIGLVGIGRNITERKAAEDALAKRTHALQTLHDLSVDLGMIDDLASLQTRVLERAVDLLNADMGGCIYLYQPEDDSLLLVDGLGPDKPYIGDRIKPGEGLSGRVFATQQPMFVVDYMAWDGRADVEDEFPFSAMLSVPLMWRGEAIGTLGVNADKERRRFDQDDVWLLELFAAQATTAIKNAQLFSDEHDQRDLAEMLAHTASLLSQTLDPTVVMRHILDNTGRLVEHDAATIFVREGSHVRLAFWRNYPDDMGRHVDAHQMTLDEPSLLHEVYTASQPVVIEDTQTYPHWRDLPHTDWIRSVVAAPIRSHGETIGFIVLDSATPGFFTALHANRLTMLADQAAIAIENAQLYERIQQYASELEQHVAARTRELRASEARYRAIVDDQMELVCRHTPDHKLTFVNESYCRWVGRSREDLVGADFMQFVPPAYHATLKALLASLGPDNPSIENEHPYTMPDGETRWQAWTDRAIFDEQGCVSEIQGVGRDITTRKRLENQLRRALEREMSVNELGTRFVSMAAHDLRNPLAVIRSATDLLAHYGDRMSKDEHLRKLSNIQRNVDLMVELLDDILTVGKVEAGRLEFRPETIDVVELCQGIIHELAVATASYGQVQFNPVADCSPAFLDKKLVRHMLTNLLSNAIKYSPQGTPVTFDLACDAEHVIFRIEDRGIGIPQADQRYLYEAFRRFRNVGNIPGTGLGLAIVKQSVDLHGGTIEVDSQEHKGTTFTVILPSGNRYGGKHE